MIFQDGVPILTDRCAALPCEDAIPALHGPGRETLHGHPLGTPQKKVPAPETGTGT